MLDGLLVQMQELAAGDAEIIAEIQIVRDKVQECFDMLGISPQ